MSMPIRSRFSLESLGDRITPTSFDGLPAFTGLDVAVEQFHPTDPCQCLEVSPVVVLNYGEPDVETLDALGGLIIADAAVPPNPVSPVFFSLAGLDGGGSVDSPV